MPGKSEHVVLVHVSAVDGVLINERLSDD